eukprot:356953-Chlamydomonas_euryale.AAC.3
MDAVVPPSNAETAASVFRFCQPRAYMLLHQHGLREARGNSFYAAHSMALSAAAHCAAPRPCCRPTPLPPSLASKPGSLPRLYAVPGPHRVGVQALL